MDGLGAYPSGRAATDVAFPSSRTRVAFASYQAVAQLTGTTGYKQAQSYAATLRHRALRGVARTIDA